MGDQVWVIHYSHRHGHDFAAADTEERAWVAARDILAEQVDDEVEDPELLAELKTLLAAPNPTKDQVSEMWRVYTESPGGAGDEYIELTETTVLPAEPAPRRERHAFTHDLRDLVEGNDYFDIDPSVRDELRDVADRGSNVHDHVAQYVARADLTMDEMFQLVDYADQLFEAGKGPLPHCIFTALVWIRG